MVFPGFSEDPIVVEVDKVTDENNSEEDWGSIMVICDKAGRNREEAKKYLKAITKRLFHSDPHVGIQAVVLLDACVKNSGRDFHLEVASRDFENDFTKLLSKGHPLTQKKMKECLKKWSENEFKDDSTLNLIPSLYAKLKTSGIDFSTTNDATIKKTLPHSNNPDVVDSQEEEEQIMQAIELSLKESTGSPRTTINTNSSIYPSTNLSNVSAVSSQPSTSVPVKDPVKVQALYDFEAAEDNELTFSAGDIIFVIDDSDPNWWKGTNQRGGEGLFPSSFVTADLSIEPEKFLYEKAKKIVQFKESVDVKVDKDDEIEINEGKIDRLLHLMHEADPTNPERDTEEMLVLEREVNSMGPLIDAELERVDRKHAQLTQLSAGLVEALGLYHNLMREPALPSMTKLPYGYPTNNVAYNGPQPHPMMGPPMGPSSLPPGMNRPPYMHPGTAIQYGPMPGMVLQQNAPPMQAGPGTSGRIPGNPGIPHQMVPNQNEERKSDPNMVQYNVPSIGNPSPLPFNYRIGTPGNSHTMLQNGSQQNTHFPPNSSSHMM